MKRFGLILVAACIAFVAQAQDLDAVQERMKTRKDDVSTLLASKTIGENNQGYLEVLKPATDRKQDKTVTDENADRKVVYTAIATKTGAKSEVVGRSRAKDVAEKAKSGTMIQKADGSWAEKK